MPSDTTRSKIPFASLHALLEKTRDTVALFDRQMKIRYISSSIEPLLG